MPDLAISGLSNYAGALGTDVIPIVDLTAGTTKKITKDAFLGANLVSWSGIATSTKLSVDGSLPMTGSLDLGSNNIKKVASLNDGSNIGSVIVSGRRLSDQAGNDIATWNSQSTGFGILTNSYYGYLKSDNLTGVKTYQLPNASGTIALTSDIPAAGVSSVSGTTNRVTSIGGTTPVIDISASYVGQSSITTLGTVGTGTWQGTAIADSYIASASTWNSKLSTISGIAASGELAGTYPSPTLLNSAVIGKVLTGYASGSGTVAATDTILQAIQKLNGNDALKISTTLTSGNIIVGNLSNVATSVTMSGDTTIDNAGVSTIGANKVTYQKTYNGNQMSIVASMKLLTGN